MSIVPKGGPASVRLGEGDFTTKADPGNDDCSEGAKKPNELGGFGPDEGASTATRQEPVPMSSFQDSPRTNPTNPTSGRRCTVCTPLLGPSDRGLCPLCDRHVAPASIEFRPARPGDFGSLSVPPGAVVVTEPAPGIQHKRLVVSDDGR